MAQTYIREPATGKVCYDAQNDEADSSDVIFDPGRESVGYQKGKRRSSRIRTGDITQSRVEFRVQVMRWSKGSKLKLRQRVSPARKY